MYSFKNQYHFFGFVGGILFVSYIWIGFNLSVNEHEGITICLIKRFLGIPCPGCGLTRAVISLCHGNISNAITLNPLVLIVAPGLVIAPLALIFAPHKCYSYFIKMEAFFSKKTGITILILFFSTLWTYLIIHNL